jgi:hypothetical protein
MEYGPTQTRLGALSDYEKALGDALERILAAGTHDLPGIVTALNQSGAPKPSTGGTWTENAFRAEMARLGH